MIDCDVHNNWPSADVLRPYLPSAFREYLERGELPGGRGSFPHAHRPWLHPEDFRRTDAAPRIVEIDGRSVGVFNVDGRFYALHNRCPHRGGTLCEGPLAGTTLPTDRREHVYGREGRVLRCAWHGWEFDVTTGRALADPGVRARPCAVTIEDGDVVVAL
jgi:nitrite reductase (NADH) small subunit